MISPKYLLLVALAVVLLIFAFSNPKQEGRTIEYPTLLVAECGGLVYTCGYPQHSALRLWVGYRDSNMLWERVDPVLAIPHFLYVGEVNATAIFDPDEDKVEPEYEITHRVYLDVDIEEQRLGRIVIGLYGQVVPKTVENFRALCTGEKGMGTNGKPLHYKGTPFHRIVSGFVIQGGDVVSGDGKGYESIYGGKFPDENFKIKHSHAGTVSMVNTGPDSNGSQFYITTVKASWLDGEHVVFGKVIQGMDTVYAIEGGAGTYNGKPRKKVFIAESGEIPKSKWEEER